MNLFIDNKSGVPIYEQIYNQIKGQIINESLKENEALPSIRNLAKDLRISVITTKRAYDELERDGFIYTVPGKGCFVAVRNTQLIREENLKEIEEHIGVIQKLAFSCKLKRQDIWEMFCLLWEESEEE